MDYYSSDYGSEQSDDERDEDNNDVFGDMIGYDDENGDENEDEDNDEENEDEDDEDDYKYIPIRRNINNSQSASNLSNYIPPSINNTGGLKGISNVSVSTLGQTVVNSPTNMGTAQQNLTYIPPTLGAQQNLTFKPPILGTPGTSGAQQNLVYTPPALSPKTNLTYTPPVLNPQPNLTYTPPLLQKPPYILSPTNRQHISLVPVTSKKNVKITPVKNVTSEDVYQMITIDISGLNDWDVRNANGEIIENDVQIPEIVKKKRYEKIKESSDTIRRKLGDSIITENIEQIDEGNVGAYSTISNEHIVSGTTNKNIMSHGITPLNKRALNTKARVIRKKKPESSNLDTVMKGLSLTCEMKKPQIITSRYNPMIKEPSESQYEYETRVKIYNALIGKNLPQDTADVISRMKKNVIMLGVDYNESMKNLLDSIVV